MLEESDLFVGQGISLSNDGDQVDLGMQSAHHLNVERLERVASRLDEVHTGVHTVVDNVHAVDLVLGLQVCIESLLNVLNDWSPRVVIVDKVTEAGCVNNCQSQPDSVLFNVCADGLDGDGLWDDVETRAFAFPRRVEGSVEEGIDKCRLSKTRLACSC